MEVIIKDDHLVYKNAMGEYHVSPELAIEKGDALEAFVIAEIKLKASQGSYKKATISFEDARKLGFCEYGIKDFCAQLGINKSKTYNLLELQEKLTLTVMFSYFDEILTLFGKSAFKRFETEISNNACYSYYYAINALKGRFEMGEKAISKDANYSYLYAINALKGRFEMGEDMVSKNANYSCLYAEHALKGRFEMGEDAISKDAKHSYYYARYALKGKFKMGEDAISKSAYCSKEYNNFINNLK